MYPHHERRLTTLPSHCIHCSLLGPHFQNRGGINQEAVEKLMELPGTQGLNELRARADSLSTWRMCLQKGVLPQPQEVEWPQEPFCTKFIVRGLCL